ncbi:Thioredoxin-like protein 1 [Zalerion maritima]|uniref:Thioredoxin-like protein 1 n=1 Tax=Zalerion maritima TaxID=339359 RepID=A0AAD5RF65_9PEZI|nr:Thioredoxin-like protein 1 [Zalerion maritima]
MLPTMPANKKPIKITSPQHLEEVKSKNIVVVADFHAEWCGPCKQIEPVYETQSQQLTHEGRIVFVKINVDEQKEIAEANNISSIPTFLIWRQGKTAPEKVKGADPKSLLNIMKKITTELENAGEGSAAGASSSGSGSVWRGAGLPRGYYDITDQVEPKGSEALNIDTDLGSVRTLFDNSKPSALLGKKDGKDWLTSIPPTDSEDDDETPMRPKTLKLFTNKPHNLGFDEADSLPATQEIVLTENDWSAEGTTNVGLRFVKFQNITSLVMFVVDGDGASEKVRLDRVRLIGESGEKREMGKLEKIGDEAGE